MTPTWAIVMTAREPAALVVANARWHLATGASEAHVYLDRADDPAAAMLAALPGCRVTVCDDAHWSAMRGRKGRPDSQMRRQSLNANHAQARSDAGWMLHLDADEFLWQDRPLADELALVSELGAELRFPVLERTMRHGETQNTLFAGRFRRVSPSAAGINRVIYGDKARFLRDGMFSHGSGKCAVPVRHGFHHYVHESVIDVDGKRVRPPSFRSTAARLLHFDGLTPLHWLVKILRYRRNPPDVQRQILPDHRFAQIDWALDRIADLPSALAAHAALLWMTEAEETRLRGFGLIDDRAFDPAPMLGDLAPALAPAAFDAALRAMEPELFALTGWT
ncbi:glycosyltransferase family 2 protein [Thalassococcus sp. CAU 1522]|uniref:Glycosyltransferase family 2 protein n=1 Tax=Thalassococcus arenae TaxID=2851652 RepID=A0ABS6N880_9RHOB|nr:glycosyltransferase family 2 protein [Thalassococcus arenae]MBV2360233.1 glycosyltransferase family 2 protein [Thalassococcus arenae]